MRAWVVFILILMPKQQTLSPGQNIQSGIVQSGFKGSVYSALTYLGRTFKISFVAECDAASDRQVTIPAGAFDGETALHDLAVQAGLALTSVAGTTYIYDKQIIDDAADQLGYVFTSFSVPRDADLFLGILQARLHNDFGKASGDPTIGGFAGSSLGNHALRGTLIEEKLDQISARDLLLREAGASRAFWAVVCYAKTTKPQTDVRQVPTDGFWSWGETTVRAK